MPRRRAGTLVPLESEILAAGMRLARDEEPCYGFSLAVRLGGGDAGRRLIGHGTLYKALARLVEAELLTAVWEDPDAATAAGRPRRKLYTVTARGEAALAAHDAPDRAASPALRPAQAGGAA